MPTAAAAAAVAAAAAAVATVIAGAKHLFTFTASLFGCKPCARILHLVPSNKKKPIKF